MSDKLHLVEGPFRNFTIRRIREQDVGKVIQHVKDYFLHDEPTSKLLGYTEQYGEDFCKIVKHYLKDNLSFWMEDNETGEVAAVRSTYVHIEDDPFWDTLTFNNNSVNELFLINDAHLKESNINGRYGVEEYADFLVASCAPKYRNQGLTTEMYRRSLILFKEVGLKLAMSIVTSPFTRAALKKHGFEEINRINYKGLKDQQENLIFDQSKLTDEHFAAIMVKVI